MRERERARVSARERESVRECMCVRETKIENRR